MLEVAERLQLSTSEHTIEVDLDGVSRRAR